MRSLLLAIVSATALLAQVTAQAPKPFQAQAASTISYVAKGDEKTVEIHNVAFEVTSEQVPGRPPKERLLLRKTSVAKQIEGDEGEEATTTIEAWPLGADLKTKPIYSLTLTGREGQTVDNALWVASRGTEEQDWWSVYKLGSGQHLFETYVPLLKFSISLDIQKERYVGLEVPPDSTADKRLKEPHVLGVLTYASEDKVLHEALLTDDDPKQALLLRSFADETHEVSLVEGPRPVGKGEPSRKIKITFSENWPSPPSVQEVVIPILGDDLDLAHAQLPAKMHIAAWRR
jgi:hypothetical protein